MYSLTLTSSERRAIDWVGYRYWHGDTFWKILWLGAHTPEDAEWDDSLDITFDVSESDAFEIKERLLEDNLACFGGELVDKLVAFHDSIV